MREWSEAARSVWGKTDRDSGLSLPLVQHLEDAALIMGYLWDTWLPRIVRERLAREIGSEQHARALVCFLAGVHDVGKASPAFAQLAHQVGMSELVSAMKRAGLRSPTLPPDERERHTLTGHVATAEWLIRRHGYASSRAQAMASIVSAHHGTPASGGDVFERTRYGTRAMGDPAWDAVRDEILDRMLLLTGATEALAAIRETKLSIQCLIDLSALVVMADWIASDESRYPYKPIRLSLDRLEQAVESLDLREPWCPDLPTDVRTLFRERFPHLDDVDPTPLQIEAAAVASECVSAPLMLIEAPTGAGKSEAAFLAAEVLAARFGAGGVYVGLPTMATSNAMFGRVLRWVDAWPDVADPTMWLAHGKAALNDDFAALVHESRIKGVHDDDGDDHGSMRVSGWLSGRRRGLLANVVVGTIDQVLMGALQARHLALRHLALSSKVVIIDEVHSADAYMRTYLVRMLEYLGGYGTPVILLSATLPPGQRAELISAYQRGRMAKTQPQRVGLVRRQPVRTRVTQGQTGSCSTESVGPGPDIYPVITTAADGIFSRGIDHDSRRFKVRLECLDDDQSALVAALDEVLCDGGCVAVIRNTVSRAQETYAALQQHFGDDVELYHSRFVAAHRANRERKLVDKLGPDGSRRPHRLIIVGTQVLEQSLDIDVDLLVTDLAPVDLVIQRVGRMHRHDRPSGDRPDALCQPRCLVTGVEDWSAPVPRAVTGSRMIYGEADLLRSLSVLKPYLDESRPLVLPKDGPVLVHRAYDPRLGPPAGWEEPWHEADTKRIKSEDLGRSKASLGLVCNPAAPTSLTGWTSTPADDAREDTARAQVRDSEDGIEVIVVQQDDQGAYLVVSGDFERSGSPIPYQLTDDEPLTRTLATCTVSLPQSLTNPRCWDDTVSELEAASVVDEWQQSKWLRGQLALVLDHTGETLLNGHCIKYSPSLGLGVAKTSEEMLS